MAAILFGHTKILHALIRMGNAALAAAVPFKATQFSRKGQRNIYMGQRIYIYIIYNRPQMRHKPSKNRPSVTADLP